MVARIHRLGVLLLEGEKLWSFWCWQGKGLCQTICDMVAAAGWCPNRIFWETICSPQPQGGTIHTLTAIPAAAEILLPCPGGMPTARGAHRAHPGHALASTQGPN